MKIGFIGTGVMGSGMVRNLLKNGYSVNVYNRTAEKAQKLVSDGAVFTSTIEECVKDADVVITIVGMPYDVEECYEQIFRYLPAGKIAIDMTTSSPSLAEKLFAEGQKVGIHVLDAPVSGGDIGAANGTLSIMVGGEKEIFDQVTPVFMAMGKTLNYIGPAGNGQHTKMANQILVAGTTAAVNEALAYVNAMGLDANTVLSAVTAGAAGSWQLTNNGPKIARKDDSPGFFIKHFIKDMGLALNEAESKGLVLEVLKEVKRQYDEMSEKGYDELGHQAIYKRYE